MRDAAGARAWFLSGLFLTTLATLALELLDTRLLSVLTWYHLSFFAVSIAMFGMSAGAVSVYLGGARFEGDRAPAALARYSLLLAVAIPASHVVNLVVPIDVPRSVNAFAALLVSSVALAVPFYLSGVVVAIALTRIPGRPGLTYGVDLVGAAIGSLAVLPLLGIGDITSSAFACAAVAALAAAAFHRFAGRSFLPLLAVGALLLVSAALNSASPSGLRVRYSKGATYDPEGTAEEHWTIHGQVRVGHEQRGVRPFYWGARWDRSTRVNQVMMTIDGAAGTPMTEWDGRPESLDWVGSDVTSVPYWLRLEGNAGIIGIGGGRDILTAIAAGSRSVLAVEINEVFVDLLTDSRRDYTKIADHPGVEIVHDEARSYFTRTDRRFDVLQMSLIDTWASTGAGAFTLSENGLYTVEAWREFRDVLEPNGIFGVSRWYKSEASSETGRLLSLAVASLLERGIAEPSRHLALVAYGRVATLVISPDPLTESDRATLTRVAADHRFAILVSPWQPPENPLFAAILASRSAEELARAVADEPYDYTPPTDERPYFFNMLRPRTVLAGDLDATTGVVIEGNLEATYTLLLLCGVSVLLVGAVIGLPLVGSGLPAMRPSVFALAIAYFAAIGAGYMLVQIPLMQRFNVYLGHPTYSVAVILFSMILATGAGSVLSDRLAVEESSRSALWVPVGIVATLAAGTASIQPVIESTIHLGLAARCAVTVAIVGAMTLPLGLCFPLGLRLVRRTTNQGTPWFWGVNGAAGVLASVAAVAISMWVGIGTSLLLATLLYALLVPLATSLWRTAAT
ncbi:MAG: hypothetical protein R3190_05735 [Thermoanaerobaculia bacterium]|nr:hypothetical protein [Thermoanaerobaculia bacterium]